MPADPLHLAIPDGLNLTGALCRTTSLGERVRVAYRTPKGGWVCVYVDGGGRTVITLPARCLRLDLSDDVSRMRALQWLASRAAVNAMPSYARSTTRHSIDQCSFGLVAKASATVGVWAVWGRHHGARFSGRCDGLGCAAGHSVQVVPALAHLDPTDPTLLPDGSRRVDALALAAVVRHYAELAAAPC